MNIYPVVWAVFSPAVAIGIPAGIPPSLTTECSPGPGRGGGCSFHFQSPHPRWRVNIVPLTKAGIVAGRGKAGGDEVGAAGREGTAEPPNKRANGM